MQLCVGPHQIAIPMEVGPDADPASERSFLRRVNNRAAACPHLTGVRSAVPLLPYTQGHRKTAWIDVEKKSVTMPLSALSTFGTEQPPTDLRCRC